MLDGDEQIYSKSTAVTQSLFDDFGVTHETERLRVAILDIDWAIVRRMLNLRATRPLIDELDRTSQSSMAPCSHQPALYVQNV